MLREISNSVRIGAYDMFRKKFSKSDGNSNAARRLAAGFVSGAVGSVAGNPFEIVKVRFQVFICCHVRL